MLYFVFCCVPPICLEYPRTEVEWHVQIPDILRSRIAESERDRPAGV